jgi:putative inorganic carbon (hco3(-)) transporter
MATEVADTGSAGVTAGGAPEETGRVAFIGFCLFVVSYFLHLGDRVSVLGALRIDILISGVVFVAILAQGKSPRAGEHKEPLNPTSKLLLAIILYILFSLPFVKWPGSVIGHGWERFLKAICFYFFAVMTITSVKRLQQFLAVFVGVQTFRVFEPLYLHLTEGYWGSFTNMGNYELMNRLSGSPFDIINPNGLAFVILVVISLAHSLLYHGSRMQKLLYLALLVPLLYAMTLTGSRSGVVVLALFALMVVWRSKHRVVMLSAVVGICVIAAVSMSDLERQRYLSIVDKDAKGAETAQGRVEGLWVDFMVGMQRPIFGHGLGTSLEANANAHGEAMPSHTLYTEVLQELGLVGVGLFIAFIVATAKNTLRAVARSAQGGSTSFLARAAQGLRDFGILLLVFSVASYGLIEYQCYLLAGLSVVLFRLAERHAQGAQAPAVTPQLAAMRPRIGALKRPALPSTSKA